MYTKTGLSILAAAGIAVGVVGMTMGGASGANTSCVPAGSADSGSSAANTVAAPIAARDADSSDGEQLRRQRLRHEWLRHRRGRVPAGPQGPSGTGTEGTGETVPIPVGADRPDRLDGCDRQPVERPARGRER